MKVLGVVGLLTMMVLCYGENLTFKGSSDKNPLLYKSGEKMTFTVTLVDKDNGNKPVLGRKLTWSRTGDDGKKERGTAISDKPLVVTTSIAKPGFVRLTVNVLDKDGKVLKGKFNKFDGGAGADVNNIEVYPMPKDFDKFWDAEVNKLYAQKYDVKLEDLNSKDPKVKAVKYSITTLPNMDNGTGVLAMPKNAKPKSLPIIIHTVGYGFGRTTVYTAEAKKGNISITTTRQGEEPDKDKAYYEEVKKNKKGFCFKNNDDKYKNDFYNMIIRNLRALQYAKSLPEWNGKTIVATGGSMGGFQAIALAALDKDVSRCTGFIPWVADLAGVAKFKRMRGWRPNFTETLGYFDTANLASRVTCPTVVTIGLGDYVCPPSGQMILFNNLKGEKKLVAKQNMGHGALYGVDTAVYTFEQKIK